jgi:tRNA G18 (ribose-2'-O)-methylase SpoU
VWSYFSTTVEAVEQLKNEGYEVWALEQAVNSLPLQEAVSFSEKKIAIVLGNEVEGVHEDVLNLCSGCIEIPQFGMKHSLNVSVAAGIVLWELVRSRIDSADKKRTKLI